MVCKKRFVFIGIFIDSGLSVVKTEKVNHRGMGTVSYNGFCFPQRTQRFFVSRREHRDFLFPAENTDVFCFPQRTQRFFVSRGHSGFCFPQRNSPSHKFCPSADRYFKTDKEFKNPLCHLWERTEFFRTAIRRFWFSREQRNFFVLSLSAAGIFLIIKTDVIPILH